MLVVAGFIPVLARGWLPLALVLLSAAPVLALEGRVIDQRTGTPVANAEISVLGRPGATMTDASGRFSWKPDPVPPFEVLVVLPGGRVLKPVLIESLGQGQPLLIEVTTLVEESVTVTGSAPSIEAPSARGTTLLTTRDHPRSIGRLRGSGLGTSAERPRTRENPHSARWCASGDRTARGSECDLPRSVRA
jgi:hypothetical protein